MDWLEMTLGIGLGIATLCALLGFGTALFKPRATVELLVKYLEASHFAALATVVMVFSLAFVEYRKFQSIPDQKFPTWMRTAALLLFAFGLFEIIWGWAHSEGPDIRISDKGWEIGSRAGWKAASEEAVIQNAWANIRAVCAMILAFALVALLPIFASRSHRRTSNSAPEPITPNPRGAA